MAARPAATLAGLLAGLLLATAPTARAEPADDDAGARHRALAATLTPPLAAVLEPVPVMRGATRADKLAFMAELAWRLDARDRYSDRPAWRALMGWPEPLDTLFTWDRAADDRSPLRYPVPGGRADPALDFAASLAVGWIDPDALSCRFPLRARFLLRHGLLRGPLALDAGRCPVDRRFDWPRVAGVDVVFVTPSFDDPSASLGHVIFRVRHAADGRATGEAFTPTFAYAAIDDPAATPFYLVRGVTGGLTASVRLESLGAVLQRYAVDEQRDLVHYALTLDRQDLHDLLAEVYAQHVGQMAVPYRFFAVNCASLAYDLVRAVRPDLPARNSLMTHPHELVSALLEAGLAVPRALVPSQRTRAALAERRRATLARALAAVPGLTPLHAALTDGAPDARATALAAFAPAAAPQLAEYVDLTIDIELQALVARDGRFDAAATSAPLDAALALRAQLPAREHARELAVPPRPVTPSGSRQSAVTIGVTDAGRLELGLRLAVLDEQAGEPRAVVLRRAGRTIMLASETRLTTAGDLPVLASERLTVLEVATWGVGGATDRGWLAAHAGFRGHLGSHSWPRDGVPWSLVLHGGPGLTLAASETFAGHLVVGLDALAEGTFGPAAAFRAGLGAFVEAALPLGADTDRARLAATLRPTWSTRAGFGLGAELDLTLDLTLDPAAGLLLRPALAWRYGHPAGNGLVFTLALAY